jgi:hypothetical protein
VGRFLSQWQRPEGGWRDDGAAASRPRVPFAGTVRIGVALLGRPSSLTGLLVAIALVTGAVIVQSWAAGTAGADRVVLFMAIVFCAALISSITGFAFSALAGAALAHLSVAPTEAVEIMQAGDRGEGEYARRCPGRGAGRRGRRVGCLSWRIRHCVVRHERLDQGTATRGVPALHSRDAASRVCAAAIERAHAPVPALGLVLRADRDTRRASGPRRVPQAEQPAVQPYGVLPARRRRAHTSGEVR